MDTHRRSSSRPPRPDTPDDGSRLSRFLALVLRHRAYQFGLEMDDEGFVDIDDLLDLMQEERGIDGIESKDLEELTVPNPRQRFEIRDGRIRATYGHSFRRLIQFPSVEPPEHLFYGLSRAKMNSLQQSGIKPTGRQYVHLSETREEAEEIGKHTEPDATAVTVLASRAHAAGIAFHHPTVGLYLVESVPPEYLQIEVNYGRGGRRSKRRGR